MAYIPKNAQWLSNANSLFSRTPSALDLRMGY
jgi:hypothetical protein